MTDLGHPLAYTAPFGYHQLSCNVTSGRIDRHNNRLRILKKHLDMMQPAIYDVDISKRLFSDSTSRKQIDMNLDATCHDPLHLSIDATISSTDCC